MDNETRWNSWYRMIIVGLQLRAAITQYQEDFYSEFDHEDLLNPADWKALADARDFLQPFDRVTKETEGDNSTLDQVLYTMDFLVHHFKASEVYIVYPKSILYIC